MDSILALSPSFVGVCPSITSITVRVCVSLASAHKHLCLIYILTLFSV
jgi:hypothetical protein